MKLTDKLGREFKVGDFVIRAIVRGRSPTLEFRCVTKIENHKIYLDESPVAINFPNRLLIMSNDMVIAMDRINHV